MNKFKVIYTLEDGSIKEFVHDDSYRGFIELIKNNKWCACSSCSDCPYCECCIDYRWSDVEKFEIIDLSQFQVGDIVEWCGASGEVIRIERESKLDYPICIEVKDNKEYFTKDGRLWTWHKEPSLKLVERAKTKESICETCVKNDVCENYKYNTCTITRCGYFLKK